MEVVVVDKENHQAFKKLMTGEAYNALINDQDVLCLGVVFDGVAVGALAGRLIGDTFNIRSLYVVPSYRRWSVATQLLDTLELIATNEASRISISFSVTNMETESLCSFFEHRGYLFNDHGGKNIYLSSMSEVSDTISFYSDGTHGEDGGLEGLAPLDSFSPEDIAEAKRQAEENRAPVPEDGFDGASVKGDLSYMFYKKGQLRGYCIIDTSVMGMPTIAALWCRNNNPMVTANVLYHSLSAVVEACEEEPFIAMTAVTAASVALIRKRLPRAMGISYTYYRVM